MLTCKKKTLVAGLACALAIACLGGCAAVNASATTLVATQVDPVAWASEPWDENTNCLECHDNMNRAVEGDTGATHVASDQATCIECHTVNDELRAVHEGKSAEEAGYSFDAQVCMDCHTWDEVADMTADSQLITTVDGAPVNPHTVHPAEAGADIDCLSCHAGHGTQVSEQSCYTCHHAQTIEGCASCHRNAEVYADYLVAPQGDAADSADAEEAQPAE